MAYKLNGKTIYLGRAFRDSNNALYPSGWLAVATDAQKAAVPTGGITWEKDPAWYDARFYNAPGTDASPKGTIPKDINELKTYYLSEQKEFARGLLSKTDWYVTRKAESDTAIPTAIATYRAAVRTKSKEREDQVSACSDTAAICTLISTNEGESGGLLAWPTEP